MTRLSRRASGPPELLDRLASDRCGIFVFDSVKDTGSGRLPDRYVPKDWANNKFSAEMWLQRALQTHPWRVDRADQADLVFIEANLSLACRAGKMFSGRSMWRTVATALGAGQKKGVAGNVHPMLAAAANVPKAVVLTDNECPVPWIGNVGPSSVGAYMMKDHGAGKFDIIAPFVLSRPPWLVMRHGNGTRQRARALGGNVSRLRAWPGAPAVVPWAERRLLFMVGHVPKLYINPTRYLIWRQIRRHPGVTALSATLNCTIGSFSICRESNWSETRWRTYCTPFCMQHYLDDLNVRYKDEPGHNHGREAPTRTTTKIARCARGRLALQRQCRSYRKVNFTDELEDMAASARNLAAPAYIRATMSHKFCMAAPGDFVSTPKITEYVAMGAAGGCLPLMVLKGEAWQTLPYVRWLDWCSIAYIITEETARTGMARVLRKLELVTEEEAEQKRAALRAVRDAFVWREVRARPRPPRNASRANATWLRRGVERNGAVLPADPSAADYLLGELCAAAKRKRLGLSMPAAPSGGVERCML